MAGSDWLVGSGSGCFSPGICEKKEKLNKNFFASIKKEPEKPAPFLHYGSLVSDSSRSSSGRSTQSPAPNKPGSAVQERCTVHRPLKSGGNRVMTAWNRGSPSHSNNSPPRDSPAAVVTHQQIVYAQRQLPGGPVDQGGPVRRGGEPRPQRLGGQPAFQPTGGLRGGAVIGIYRLPT